MGLRRVVHVGLFYPAQPWLHLQSRGAIHNVRAVGGAAGAVGLATFVEDVESQCSRTRSSQLTSSRMTWTVRSSSHQVIDSRTTSARLPVRVCFALQADLPWVLAEAMANAIPEAPVGFVGMRGGSSIPLAVMPKSLVNTGASAQALPLLKSRMPSILPCTSLARPGTAAPQEDNCSRRFVASENVG
jgi:hypothetical protein|eukprot:COSAG02_NODE_5557_length_4231_cov_1.573572_2_plen_187_part_00